MTMGSLSHINVEVAQYGRIDRYAGPLRGGTQPVVGAPSWCRREEAAIYRHILIPTDGSKLSTKAVAEGVELGRVLGSRLTFVTITEPLASLGDQSAAFAGMPESFRCQALEYLEAEARDALSTASSAAKAASVPADTLMVESDQPHEAIIAAAKANGADLILMASHGRSGVKAVLLGSVTQKVLTHTDLPVLV